MPKKREPVSLYELRIALMYVEPEVWRRVTVPRDITLGALHTVIQVAMGWDDDHLHEFEIGKKRYGPRMRDSLGLADPPIDEGIVHLNGVAKPKAVLGYEYDFGDGWLHEIRIEREVASEAGGRKARCIAGENACPPEDCGGPGGYANLLAVLADPADEEWEHMREWIGDDFDQHRFDLAQTDKRVSKLKV